MPPVRSSLQFLEVARHASGGPRNRKPSRPRRSDRSPLAVDAERQLAIVRLRRLRDPLKDFLVYTNRLAQLITAERHNPFCRLRHLLEVGKLAQVWAMRFDKRLMREAFMRRIPNADKIGEA